MDAFGRTQRVYGTFGNAHFAVLWSNPSRFTVDCDIDEPGKDAEVFGGIGVPVWRDQEGSVNW